MAPPVPAASMRRAAFLRPEEHRVEIGADYAAPLLFGYFDRAVGVRDAGVVDQNGDGAERLLGLVEGARHGLAVEHIGLDRDGPAAGGFDARLDGGEPIGAARHQRDRGAILGQHFGETHAQPARRAGDQRDAAGEIEQVGRAHRPPHACHHPRKRVIQYSNRGPNATASGRQASRWMPALAGMTVRDHKAYAAARSQGPARTTGPPAPAVGSARTE